MEYNTHSTQDGPSVIGPEPSHEVQHEADTNQALSATTNLQIGASSSQQDLVGQAQGLHQVPDDVRQQQPAQPVPQEADLVLSVAQWSQEEGRTYRGYLRGASREVLDQVLEKYCGLHDQDVPEPPDFPLSDEQKESAIQDLFNAFVNLKGPDGAIDVVGRIKNAKAFDIELVCRFQLDMAIDAASGKCRLPGYAVGKAFPQWKQYDTFQERLAALVEFFKANKAACKNLLDAPWTARYAWALNREIQTKNSNKKLNAQRKVDLDKHRKKSSTVVNPPGRIKTSASPAQDEAREEYNTASPVQNEALEEHNIASEELALEHEPAKMKERMDDVQSNRPSGQPQGPQTEWHQSSPHPKRGAEGANDSNKKRRVEKVEKRSQRISGGPNPAGTPPDIAAKDTIYVQTRRPQTEVPNPNVPDNDVPAQRSSTTPDDVPMDNSAAQTPRALTARLPWGSHSDPASSDLDQSPPAYLRPDPTTSFRQANEDRFRQMTETPHEDGDLYTDDFPPLQEQREVTPIGDSQAAVPSNSGRDQTPPATATRLNNNDEDHSATAAATLSSDPDDPMGIYPPGWMKKEKLKHPKWHRD